MFKIFNFCLFILLISSASFSQDTIYLDNPSFEDTPRKGGYYQNSIQTERNKIKGWYDCGVVEFPAETAPDIHSSETHFWSVSHDPSHGNTFLSLTCRDDNTWESITQQLSEDLIEDTCYEFKIDLSQSKSFKSSSRLYEHQEDKYNYSEPLVLEVWLGRGYCSKENLLFVFPPVDHLDWKTYTASFSPTMSASHITIIGYYKKGEEDPYNGHILLDNLTDIVKIECSDD